MLFEFMDSDTIVRKVAQDLNNLRSLPSNVLAQMSKEPHNTMGGSAYPNMSNADPPLRITDKLTMVFMVVYTFLLSQT